MTTNETSQPKAADPVCRGHLANVTSKGSAVFSGLETERVLMGESARYIRLEQGASPNSEDQDGSPVAIWALDPMHICHWCGLMTKFGRGPVVKVICNPCHIEFPGLLEVPHE